MSGEPVKTALADRSSIKPFQFIPIHSRSRIGCRMMSPLAACLPSSSCVAIVLLACRFLIRSAHSSRPAPRCACRASAPYPPARLVSSACPVCSPPRSAYPPRSSCRRAGRPSSRSHLVMRFACAAFACLPAVLRSARLRSAVKDVIAPFLRSVATVPPLSRLAYSPRRSCRWAGRCRAVMFARAIFFFLWDFYAVG